MLEYYYDPHSYATQDDISEPGSGSENKGTASLPSKLKGNNKRNRIVLEDGM